MCSSSSTGGFPGRRSPSVKEQIFKAQKEFILNVAAKKSCIVVGRCSDAVLEDVPNHLHIYIYAPLSQRYDNCIHKLMLSPQAAGKMIEDVDRARENYHLQYAGYKPDDPAHKDIMINSAVLGIQGTADYLTELVRLKFGS